MPALRPPATETPLVVKQMRPLESAANPRTPVWPTLIGVAS